LRHDVASSFAADSRSRGVQFALPFPRSSITVFRRDSFGRDVAERSS
jgi:hypothetical protein